MQIRKAIRYDSCVDPGIFVRCGRGGGGGGGGGGLGPSGLIAFSL